MSRSHKYLGKIHVKVSRPKGRLLSPSEFKMGTRYHKVKRREDLQYESTECDTCAICSRTDVTDDGEWLDSREWVCYTCVRDAIEGSDMSDTKCKLCEAAGPELCEDCSKPLDDRGICELANDLMSGNWCVEDYVRLLWEDYDLRYKKNDDGLWETEASG